MHATRPKGGPGIHALEFCILAERKCSSLYFARGEFVSPLRRPISVALLLLSHVFEYGNSSKMQCG